MKPGNHIIFDLQTWTSEGRSILKTVKAKVLDIFVDPLGYHESKCWVEINHISYGIPFSEIKKVIPTNEQLKLQL